MSFEEVSEWIADHQEAMVELQRELTARPALGPENGGAGEWEKARFLEDHLRRHGFETAEHFDCPDPRVPEGTRPNFLVTLPGKQDEPRAWVLTHLDVVPPGEKDADGSWRGWDSDPFALRRVGDVLVGRGVSDDQQAVVSSIFAARALRENGLTPAHTVKLVFVADEETGSNCGFLHILRAHAGIFSREDSILVPDWGEEDSSVIEVAEKSVLWLQFRVRGKQAHGSRPDLAVNTARAAAWLTYMLDEGLKAGFNRVDHLYDVPRSTFEPTMHQANVANVNTIPGEDVFCFDCRVLPQYGLDSVLAFANAQCRRADGLHGTTTEVSVRNRQDAPPPTPPDSAAVRKLKAAIQRVYGVEPRTTGIGGMTLASPLRERGLPAAVWMTCNQTGHQVNETCHIAHMVGDARVFAHVYLDES